MTYFHRTYIFAGIAIAVLEAGYQIEANLTMPWFLAYVGFVVGNLLAYAYRVYEG